MSAAVATVPSHNASSVSGTETVTVACKIPQGLRCVLHEKRTITEVTQGGSRTVDQYFPMEDKEFVVSGPAHSQNEGPRVRIVAGYALTEGIRKDLWDEWAKQNTSLPAMRNRLIFAYPKMAVAVDAAKDNKNARTGLERLNPNALPTLDKRFPLKTADDAVAQIGRIHDEE